MSAKRTDKGTFSPTHNMSRTLLYKKWASMKSRCNNPKDPSYKSYGGKGLTVCAEWNDSFENFYEWSIKNGYEDGLTIDRINNSKGYFPENCRYVTYKEQNRNVCRNHLIAFNGKTQCLVDWANELGLSKSCLQGRIKKGLSIEQVLDKKNHKGEKWPVASLEVDPE